MQVSEFASLLCSRLCHDLVSPVGAISNALELLDEDIDAETKDQVMDLLRQSSRQTAQKLQFFRLAFGAAGGFSETLDMREAEKVLRGLVDGTPIVLDWQVDVRMASKSAIKMLLALILIGFEALVRGGTLRVECPDDKGDGILGSARITALGPRVIPLSGLSGIFSSYEQVTPDPRTAPAYLAALIARDMNFTLSANISEGDNPELIMAANSPG